MNHSAEAGFTLIETLIAMAVLAVGSVTLLTAVERHAAQTTALENRVAARWVAENALTALALGVQAEPQWTRMLGQDWDVQVKQRALDDTGLSEVVVTVGLRGTPAEAGIAQLTGFLVLKKGSLP